MTEVLEICGDCGVKEGEFHLENCDQEVCSCCGKQVLMHGRCPNTKPEPFFSRIGFYCERCGKYLPKFKMVSNDEWKFICGGTYKFDCVLCEKCMDFIKKKRRMK